MSVKLLIQIMLNFIALDKIFNPIANVVIPVSGIGVFFKFLILGYTFVFLLFISYLPKKIVLLMFSSTMLNNEVHLGKHTLQKMVRLLKIKMFFNHLCNILRGKRRIVNF